MKYTKDNIRTCKSKSLHYGLTCTSLLLAGTEAATDHSSQPTHAPRQLQELPRDDVHSPASSLTSFDLHLPMTASSQVMHLHHQQQGQSLPEMAATIPRNRQNALEGLEQHQPGRLRRRTEVQKAVETIEANYHDPGFDSVVEIRDYPIKTTLHNSNSHDRRKLKHTQLEQRNTQQLPLTEINQIVTRTQYDTSSTCDTQTQQLFQFHFQTDSYGSETSWFLKESDSITDNSIGKYLGFGPPSGYQYGDLTIYRYSFCLDVGKSYVLALEDDFGDGICCDRGFGGYEFLIGGVRVYSSDYKETFHEFVEHEFVVLGGEYTAMPSRTPTPKPTGVPTSSPVDGVDLAACYLADPDTCGCEEVNMMDYRGNISVTETGLECMEWTAQSPHVHPYLPESFPEAGLESNYCRNPNGGADGKDPRPWCFTMDSAKRWEYCNVPVCGVADTDDDSDSGIDSDDSISLIPTLSPAEAFTSTPIPTTAPTANPTIAPIPPTSFPSFTSSETPSQNPTMAPTARPTNKPTNNYSILNPSNGCYGGDVHVKIEVRADEFSTDTSWELFAPNGTKVLHELAGTFEKLELKTQEMCLPHGLYEFNIYDVYGDGICCRYGEGFYRIHLDGHEVVVGGSFNEKDSIKLNVGFDPIGYMSEREKQYLEAHNRRRKEWHERYNLTYVPLKYSPALASDSKDWAEELLNACGIVGIEHETKNPFGENLAKNTGSGGWGQLYPPENIVARWVDFEIGWPYPSNGHLTQALWRASKYLGCGESVKKFRNGYCRVQVCRYGRAGNCDMSHYNATEGENWLSPMLAHYSRCGPNCPQEGCF
mmetsp:Transcript_29206/g.58536  ORF Transcript_29206/g.58536 Transcript_29206/m.58536 type:complete len:820 (+) Transcript_29206:196-2655(+)